MGWRKLNFKIVILSVQGHVKTFMSQLKKFAARWEQLKPKNVDLEGDRAQCEVRIYPNYDI